MLQVIYSARFHQDDAIHRTFFFLLMVLVASACTSVQPGYSATIQTAGGTYAPTAAPTIQSNSYLPPEGYVCKVVFLYHCIMCTGLWIVWYLMTSYLVNATLPKPTPDTTASNSPAGRASGFDLLTPSSMGKSLGDLAKSIKEAAAVINSKNRLSSVLAELVVKPGGLGDGERCCSFMRKEALADCKRMVVLMCFFCSAVAVLGETTPVDLSKEQDAYSVCDHVSSTFSSKCLANRCVYLPQSVCG